MADPLQPWLSVLVPAFNVEPYIRACLESVLAQVDDGVEIVVLDDASPDGSIAIVRELQRAYPDAVRIVSHAVNKGLSTTRNALIDAANGRYLWFLDSDDEMLPGAIDGLRAVIGTQAPDLVMCNFRVLRESSRLHHLLRGESHRPAFVGEDSRLSMDRDDLIVGLLEGRQLHAWSKIAKADVWKRVRFPEDRLFEDMAVIPQLVRGVHTWRHEARPWVGYRQRGDSIMATMTPKKTRDVLSSLQDVHHGLLRLPGGISVEARLAVDYFCLRTFASLARKVPREDVELDGDCQEAMHRIFPEGVGATLNEYRARGWGLRVWRARRSLEKRGWA